MFDTKNSDRFMLQKLEFYQNNLSFNKVKIPPKQTNITSILNYFKKYTKIGRIFLIRGASYDASKSVNMFNLSYKFIINDNARIYSYEIYNPNDISGSGVFRGERIIPEDLIITTSEYFSLENSDFRYAYNGNHKNRTNFPLILLK